MDRRGLVHVQILSWYEVRIKLETDGRWTSTLEPGYAFASQFIDLVSLFKKVRYSIGVGELYELTSQNIADILVL